MSQKISRPVVIAGNWKMYKTIDESVGYVETLSSLMTNSQVSVYLAVPFTAIYPTIQRAKSLRAPITIGAQNMHDATEGAFTGEIAAKMLVDVGAGFVVLGHSERRHLFHESSSFINRKVKQALASNIQPIVCIGETLEQRKKSVRERVLKDQILQSLDTVTAEECARIILAYEPVWAIGTGKVAKPKDAQTAHAFCRSVVAEKWGKKAALQLPMLYGGSVNPENASSLLDQEDVDGLLVGGASLSPESFNRIINTYQGKTKV